MPPKSKRSSQANGGGADEEMLVDGASSSSRLISLLPERVGNVASSDYPSHDFPGKTSDGSTVWNIERFKKQLKLKINRVSNGRVELDLVHVDPSVANAIRRCLIAEVPTVAAEHIYISDNTSIVQDEVLAHRLGLVPLRFDPNNLTERGLNDPTDENTVVFKLHVECTRKRGAKPDEEDPHKKYENSDVLSSMLEWQPQLAQEDEWRDDPPRPVHSDILLAKLRPGQAISLEMHCEKNCGRMHAKYSPVATASYRLLPHISLHSNDKSLEPIRGPAARRFQRCFARGVIGLRRESSGEEVESESSIYPGKARGMAIASAKERESEAREQQRKDEEVPEDTIPYVLDARKDTVSREVLRYPEFEGKVKLGRIRDHFLFDIESTGVVDAEVLMPSALSVLLKKIRVVRRSAEELERTLGLSNVDEDAEMAS